MKNGGEPTISQNPYRPGAMALSGLAWIVDMRHQTADTEKIIERMKSEKHGEGDAEKGRA